MVVTVEVIDAVQRTLEQDGLLQTLKAQLRSSVLRIVKQSSERVTSSNPNLNFIRSFEGAPIIQLVRDILVHLNLRETVLVFDAETGYEEIDGKEFDNFLQKLGISKSNRNGSYLEQLVQNTLQGAKSFVPHTTSREENNTIRQIRSVSSKSSEERFNSSPKELKSYLEEDDDDDLHLPDISSAINFSKFLNKSRAEQKEMMLGDNEPQAKPLMSSSISSNPVSQPKFEEKPVPNVEKSKSPTEMNAKTDEDFNNKYKNLLDDDDDDDFEIDDKFFANSKLLGGKKEITPVPVAVPPVTVSKGEEEKEVKQADESEDEDEHQINPAVENEESDSFVDDEEEVKYELPKRQTIALDHSEPIKDEAKTAEAKESEFKTEEKQSKNYQNDYDEQYEDDVEEVIEEVQESFVEEEDDEIEQSRVETKPSQKPSVDLEEPKDNSPKIFPQRSRSREDSDEDEPVSPSSSQAKSLVNNNTNHLKVDAKVDNLPSVFGNKKPSSLAPLPDLKIPSRFGNNLKDLLSDDAKSFDSSSQGKLQSKKSEESDKGPEFSEEEVDEEEFSQLDHELSVNKSFESSRGPGGAAGDESSFSQDLPQGKASNAQTKIVNSRYEEAKETKEETNSTSLGNRANVSRLSQQSTIRSTRGWNDVDERRDHDFVMDEDDDEETDQTELPYRGGSFTSSTAGIPGRGSSNQRGTMHLQDADEIANLDISTDHRHSGDDSELHASYRSNQEEEDDHHIQRNNEQKEDDGEVIIHHEEEEEFDDFEEEEEEESVPAYQPRGITKKEDEAPVKAFTTTNKIPEKKQQNEEEEEEDEYNDDYGDDFENEEENLNNSRFSNKGAGSATMSNKGSSASASNNNYTTNKKQEIEEEDEEIEEIEEEIEEEEDADKMSVGDQSESDDDDGGLGQRWAPKSKPGLTSSNSSLFRQQSGTLPTLNNNNNNKPASRSRYDFSKLNDDDEDEEDDEDDAAYTFDLNRGSGSGSGRESKYQSKDEIQKRLKEIDQQVTSMEDEDEEGVLSNIKSTFVKNNNSSTASSLRKSSDLRNLKDFDDRDENSVASENLSVGEDDNSEEESFSVGH